MTLWSTKSVLFNGTTQYATGGDVLGAVLEYNVAWSISLWFKTPGPSGMLIGKGAGTVPYKGIQLYAPDHIALQLISGNAAVAALINTTETGFADDTWHHLALTKATGASIAGGDFHIYVDNADLTFNPPSHDNLYASVATTNPFLVGAWTLGNLYPFTGNIDEVAIYDKELSAAEVEWLYNVGTPSDLSHAAAPSNLVSWWQMGENRSAATLPDQQGSNDLNMVNSPTVEDEAPAGSSYYSSYVGTSYLTSHQFDADPVAYTSDYVDTSYLDPWEFYPFTSGGGGPTLKYKMRGQDSGVTLPGYVTWVATGTPDFVGAGYPGGSPTPVGGMTPNSAVVADEWEE